jgi:hypothetical protein
MVQQSIYGIDQVWNWLTYEVSVHPFLFAGIAVIIVSAWFLYKAEVRTK